MPAYAIHCTGQPLCHTMRQPPTTVYHVRLPKDCFLQYPYLLVRFYPYNNIVKIWAFDNCDCLLILYPRNTILRHNLNATCFVLFSQSSKESKLRLFQKSITLSGPLLLNFSQVFCILIECVSSSLLYVSSASFPHCSTGSLEQCFFVMFTFKISLMLS